MYTQTICSVSDLRLCISPLVARSDHSRILHSMGKPIYPDHQEEANKTPAYKGGVLSVRQGTMTVIFKANHKRDKWRWSATSSSAAGTSERQEEHRTKARVQKRGVDRRAYNKKYLERMSAEYGVTITSFWKLHLIRHPDYPRRGSSDQQQRVLAQPEFAELLGAVSMGTLSDADISQSVCFIIGIRDLLDLQDEATEATPWERTTQTNLLALLRITDDEEGSSGEDRTLLRMTDVENHGQTWEDLWDAAVGVWMPDGTIKIVWSATAVQGGEGRAFSRKQVSAADTCAHYPGPCVSRCTVT